MKQYRYVVNGKAGAWKSLENTTVAMLKYLADAFNERFDDWYMEYR